MSGPQREQSEMTLKVEEQQEETALSSVYLYFAFYVK